MKSIIFFSQRINAELSWWLMRAVASLTYLTCFFWTPALRKSPMKLASVRPWLIFLGISHQIFLIFCMKLEIHSGVCVTDPDSFFLKTLILEKNESLLLAGNSIKLNNSLFSIVLPRPHIWENSGSRIMGPKVFGTRPKTCNCPIFWKIGSLDLAWIGLKWPEMKQWISIFYENCMPYSMTRSKMCIWLFWKIGFLVWAVNGIYKKIQLFLIIVFTFRCSKSNLEL